MSTNPPGAAAVVSLRWRVGVETAASAGAAPRAFAALRFEGGAAVNVEAALRFEADVAALDRLLTALDAAQARLDAAQGE
jgi:hypothetical protein